MKCLVRTILIMIFIVINSGLHAETPQNEVVIENQSFTDKVNNLKKQVLELNRDLFILEEELLFPVNTQINVFISIDAGFLFKLDSVQLKIDDKVVSNYLYTEREIQALHRGGIQRLYVGNMVTGEHELTAVFIGKGPLSRDYKRASTIKINKTDEAKFVELKITANTSKEQPDFSIKVWE
ncbi:MAG: AraC family transcriptional regulator [Gammaproteobacteria bacterium]|nr:AraC family transcriptional regulator [Gammaproteobacteria bacterium]